MATPRSVQTQIDEANRIQQEIIEGKTGEPEPAELLKTEPEVVPEKTDSDLQASKEPGKQPEPAKAKSSELELLRDEVGHLNKRLIDFKKMYDRAVNEHKGQLEVASGKLGELTTQLSESQQNNQPVNYGARITEARSEYGDELVDSLIAEIRKELKPLKPVPEPVLKTDSPAPAEPARTNESPANVWEYLRSIDSQVDWTAVNNEPEFLKWLAETDFNGNSRHNILNSAMTEGRFVDAAQLFIEWDAIKRERRISDARTGKVDEGIMPDSGSSGGGEPLPQGRRFTGTEYQHEKTQIAKGHYSKEEGIALNLELESAYVNNMIDW